MSENQSTLNQPIAKVPLYMWLVVGILVVIILFCMFCKSTDLSGNKGGLVQGEVNDKIKALRDDSIKKYRVVKFLETWELNLKLLKGKLEKQSDSLIKNYNFALKAGDVIEDGKTAVSYYTFTSKWNEALINSLSPVAKINNEYGILLNNQQGGITDDFYWDNNFTDDDKVNLENIRRKITKQLIIYYKQAFSISQSENLLNFDADSLTRQEVDSRFAVDRKSIFSEGLRSWLTALKNKSDEITDFKENISNEQNDVRTKIQGLLDETTEINSLSRDKVLLGKILPVFTILILLLFAIPYIYRNVIVKDGTKEVNVLTEIFSKGLLLKIFTVFLLTISIVLLAIGDKIKGETIGTLLGGISVYILQNSFGAGNNTPLPDPNPVPNPAPAPKRKEDEPKPTPEVGDDPKTA